MPAADTFQALHPDPTKRGARISRATYETYRDALLALIPATEDGIAFADLVTAVAARVPAALGERTSPAWWTETVKLDLEARGLIERFTRNRRQYLRRR